MASSPSAKRGALERNKTWGVGEAELCSPEKLSNCWDLPSAEKALSVLLCAGVCVALVGQSVASVCFCNPAHVGRHASIVTALHSFGKDKYYCMVGEAKQRDCNLEGSEPRLP